MRIHELHAPVKVVQRSKGRSAVAAAAYRSGQRIEDERTGLVHDYTGKRGIEAEALFLPDNAPDYAHDRAKLWNAAERRETHPRAQTARDLTVSFPSEFSAEQRREAGMRIAQFLSVRYGAAVDVAWHEPNRKGSQLNHHMHALFTTRRWDENGEWAKTKDRTLDDVRAKKIDGVRQEPQGPEEIKSIRLGVADALNNIAARDKLDVYVEHLSFEQRGQDREATQHLGPIATGMERQGVETDIGNKNREIRQRNEQRQQLREDGKVIDIEIAREQLQAKRQAGQQQSPSPAPPERQQQPAADPYAEFYREAQARRSALLDDLNRQHGEREKQLRQDIARLTSAEESAGFFSKIWRSVSGRAKAEREQMSAAARNLEAIQRERQTAHEAFERDRQGRLETLKAAQVAQELERQRQAQAQVMPRAVGDRPAARTAPPRQEAAIQPQTPAPQAASAPAADYEVRRRAYFQRLGAQRKAERAREKPASSADQAGPKRDFEKATEPKAPVPPDGVGDYDARIAAYMRRLQKQREHNRDRGPTRER